MAEIFSAKARLSTASAGLKLASAELVANQKKLIEWNLAPWEDALLFELFPVSSDIPFASDDYKDTLELLRGTDSTTAVDPIPAEGLSGGYAFAPQSFADPEFQRSLLRSVYLILREGDNNQAILLMARLEEDFIAILPEFERTVPREMIELYKRIYIILLNNFFRLLPDDIQIQYFQSDQIIQSLQLGFNIEEVVRQFVDTYSDLSNRQEACLNFSAGLAANDTALGIDAQNRIVTIKYWIDSFRIYSKNKFGGIELVNFLNDRSYVGKLSGGDISLIRQICELYTHLINGFLMLPLGNLERIGGLVAQLEAIPDLAPGEAKQLIDPDRSWAEMLAKPVSDGWKQSVKDWLKVQDAEESREVFKEELASIPWQDEPYLTNILQISDIFEDCFPEAGPLIYFDEQTGSFAWSEK